MLRELYPEVALTFSRTPEGRQLAVHNIDKFPRHWNQMRNGLDRNRWGMQVNTLSAISFHLPFPVAWESAAFPTVCVSGTGLGEVWISIENVRRSGELLDPAGNWEILSPSISGVTRLHRLRESREDLVGIPTIAIHPFLGSLRYEVGALRRYNILLGAGSDFLQVDADTRQSAEKESLKLRYVSDPRDNYSKDIASLKRSPDGWVITPSSRRYPTYPRAA